VQHLQIKQMYQNSGTCPLISLGAGHRRGVECQQGQSCSSSGSSSCRGAGTARWLPWLYTERTLCFMIKYLLIIYFLTVKGVPSIAMTCMSHNAYKKKRKARATQRARSHRKAAEGGGPGQHLRPHPPCPHFVQQLLDGITVIGQQRVQQGKQVGGTCMQVRALWYIDKAHSTE